jgi:tetracycline 7-halogenase / FADH2 O2-dependent halogenase
VKTDFDLAIVGSGFGGSLLAMVAQRIGLSVLLVERGRHPRFAIGESTSPLTNLILEQIARQYDLPRLLPLTTFGAWRRAYPEIGCGLKRGFTYYKQEPDEEFTRRPDRANELLVAASPNDEVSDTHWLRSDVDHLLLSEAVALGVDYVDETRASLDGTGDSGSTLTLERDGQTTGVTCRLLVDASGPRGFLFRALSLPESQFAGFPRTNALFSHFAGVHRTADMPQFASTERPPFAPDAAALHHVFDGGWMWVLRFENGVTSAGVSVDDAMADELRLADRAPAWERLLARYPTVRAQFADSQPIREFTYAPGLAFRSTVAAGAGWAMLPSAAAFVDPLFSTGIPLTLIGIERLGRILEETWNGADLPGRLREYGDLTLADADWTAEFVGGCFAGMPHFQLFVEYSMYYFAAASFSEIARRVERRELASRFLCQNRAGFAAGLRSGSDWLRRRAAEARSPEPGDVVRLAGEVAAAVRGSNIAGLCDPAKRNWYGIDWNDLVENARYLDYTPDAMRALLAAADWADYPA